MDGMLSFSLLIAEQPTTGPAGAQPQPPPTGSILLQFVVPLALVFGIMYLFILRPQHKREKERRSMLDAVGKGSDVVTIGGVHGKVVQVKDEEVVLDVGDGNKITFSRGAIARVVTQEERKQ